MLELAEMLHLYCNYQSSASAAKRGAIMCVVLVNLWDDYIFLLLSSTGK